MVLSEEVLKVNKLVQDGGGSICYQDSSLELVMALYLLCDRLRVLILDPPTERRYQQMQHVLLHIAADCCIASSEISRIVDRGERTAQEIRKVIGYVR